MALLSLVKIIQVGNACITVTAALIGTALHANEATREWGNDVWLLRTDLASGALVRIERRADPLHMNWLREAGYWNNRKWTRDGASGADVRGGQWGLVETAHTGSLHVARTAQIGEAAWEASYMTPTLTVTVRRELDADGGLTERYIFKNTSSLALDFPVGTISITAPFFDQYPDAQISLPARCHTHLWMGGHSAWINASRMDGQAPGLGLVMSEGGLHSYSQRGGTNGDRGIFLLHPAAMRLPPGKSQSIAWRLFWHEGWDDFFAKLQAQEHFVRLDARRLVVEAGAPLEITAASKHPLEQATLTANGKAVTVTRQSNTLRATLPTTIPGEVRIELRDGDNLTWLNANVVPRIDDLIDARVRFILKNQQRNRPNDPLDGAYLAYDNETDTQIDSRTDDHNAARERVGMGVLAALYLPCCTDPALKAELQASLARYSAFIAREIEDERGTVYNSIGRRGTDRLYNWPWVAHFHLAMYQATGDTAHLDRMVRVCRDYYVRGGDKFYAIGIPVTDILAALAKAGRTAEREELLTHFRQHADRLLSNGTNYPKSEVNFEQAIVAPAVQLLLETYQATRDERYLNGARLQLRVLEAFCGRQPDHRLHGVAIRHWDDYWFGKLHTYGDTMPHYWSTLNALVDAHLARSTGEPAYFERARTTLLGNLSLFTSDGRASAAHLNPLFTDGKPGARNDPWANDQDWTLVNLIVIRRLSAP
jgi:hypothetical protein